MKPCLKIRSIEQASIAVVVAVGHMIAAAVAGEQLLVVDYMIVVVAVEEQLLVFADRMTAAAAVEEQLLAFADYMIAVVVVAGVRLLVFADRMTVAAVEEQLFAAGHMIAVVEEPVARELEKVQVEVQQQVLPMVRI